MINVPILNARLGRNINFIYSKYILMFRFTKSTKRSNQTPAIDDDLDYHAEASQYEVSYGDYLKALLSDVNDFYYTLLYDKSSYPQYTDNPDLLSDWHTRRGDYIVLKAQQQAKKKAEERRGYRYLLTFTLKQDFDDETVRIAEQWIHRNVVNPLHKPLPGRVWIAKEKTEAGRVHWHVCGTYGISLKKNLFKYYEKKYGSIDFSRSKGEKEEITLGYLSKEEVPTLLN